MTITTNRKENVVTKNVEIDFEKQKELNRVKGKVYPCQENTFIVDGNKVNPNTGLSSGARILMD